MDNMSDSVVQAALHQQQPPVFVKRKRPLRSFFLGGLIFAVIAILCTSLYSLTRPSAPPVQKSTLFSVRVYNADGSLLQTGGGFLYQNSQTVLTCLPGLSDDCRIELQSAEGITFNTLCCAASADDSYALLTLAFPTDLTPVNVSADCPAIGQTVWIAQAQSEELKSARVQALLENGFERFELSFESAGTFLSGSPVLNEVGAVVGILQQAANGRATAVSAALPEILDGGGPLSQTACRFSNVNAPRTQMAFDESHLYHTFMRDAAVVEVDRLTGEQRRLDIFGHGLNVYRGVLYVLSNDGSAIQTYDGATGIYTKNILNTGCKEMFRLYVCDQGIFVLWKSDPAAFMLTHLDFDGSEVKSVVCASAMSVFTKDELIMPVQKTKSLVRIRLSDFSRRSIPLSFIPNAAAYAGGADCFLSAAENTVDVYRYNLETDRTEKLEKTGCLIYHTFVGDGCLYYPTQEGTVRQGLDSQSDMLISGFQFLNVNFDPTGFLYAGGCRPDAELQVSSQMYLRMQPDGSGAQILYDNG